MPSPTLYSVNSHYAVQVARKYRNNSFYAWCSEVFSAGQQAGDAPSSMVAASSDPQTIYEQLHAAVASEDRHDYRIKQYRKTFKRLAELWYAEEQITKEQRDDIRTDCAQQSFRMWRPLLYVISRPAVEARLSRVPAAKRASSGEEFIIADLQPSEFDIVELPLLRGR